MIRSTFLAVALSGLSIAAVACTSATDTGSSEDDLRASSACAKKACGDSCTLCNGRPNCFETAVLKACSADGRCRAEQPVCSTVDAGAAYDPCGGKTCGDTCKVCPPSDPNCFETQEVKTCNAQGACSSTPTTCDVDGGSAYEPCGGKACGDTCKICPPSDPNCFETQEVKACDGQGKCSSSPVICGGAYKPCAGKVCGQTCKICPPNDANCFETQELKVCHPDGACTGQVPACN